MRARYVNPSARSVRRLNLQVREQRQNRRGTSVRDLGRKEVAGGFASTDAQMSTSSGRAGENPMVCSGNCADVVVAGLHSIPPHRPCRRAMGSLYRCAGRCVFTLAKQSIAPPTTDTAIASAVAAIDQECRLD